MHRDLAHNNQFQEFPRSSFEKNVLNIAIFLLLLFTFFQYGFTGYTTRDDTLTALNAINPAKHLEEPIEAAKQQGRLIQIFNSYLDFVPYIIDSDFYFSNDQSRVFGNEFHFVSIGVVRLSQ